MVIVVLIVLALVILVATRLIKNSAARNDYEAQAGQNPLDAELAEVFRRPDASAGWKVTQAAEGALRDATRHIHQRTREQGHTPLLIAHSGLGYDPTARNGLLVVTTAETMLFAADRLHTVAHRSRPTTKIMAGPNGRDAAVTIHGDGAPLNVACPDLEQARLICSAIDLWAEEPELEHDPRVRVTPHRVLIPDAFFIDVLRTAGHRVTPTNMRSIHEKFGMMFMLRARKFVDSTYGEVVGERFTADFGRPHDDRELPYWAAGVLEGWIALEPKIGYTLGPFMADSTRKFLLEMSRTGGYLSDPSRPLSMWMNDWYEDDGCGARKVVVPGQPPVSA